MSCVVYYVTRPTRPTQNRFQGHVPNHAQLSAHQRSESKPDTLDDAVHTEGIFERNQTELNNRHEEYQKNIDANKKAAEDILSTKKKLIKM